MLRAHVVGHDAAGAEDKLWIFSRTGSLPVRVLNGLAARSTKLVDLRHDGREYLRVEYRRRPRKHAHRALHAHAGIDVVAAERLELPFRVLVVLHEHVVPDLDVLAAVAAGTAVGAALGLARVDEHLGVGTARTRGAGRTPPVVLAREREDVVVGKALLLPERDRLVVARDAVLAREHGDVQILRVEAELSGEELVAPGDRLGLEVVVERPVAEHLEERKVRRVAHRVDVARANALLHVGEARTGGMRHLPHQVRHERVHARRGEEHRRVVLGNHARALDARVPLRLEEAQIRLAKFVCCQLVHLYLFCFLGKRILYHKLFTPTERGREGPLRGQ